MSIEHYQRPIRVSWVLPPVPAGQDWPSLILSKSLAKQARKIKQLLVDFEIECAALPLTNELYQEWHAFYVENMKSLGHDVLASATWYEERHAVKKNCWLLSFKRYGEFVGGSILSEDFEGLVAHHYKATARIDLGSVENTSLGSLMELAFLDFAFSLQPKQVSSGSSRNGFGYFNTLGYLTSKLRMGYRPIPLEERGFDQEFISETPTTPTVWVALSSDQTLTLVLFPDAASFNSELLTYIERAHLPILEYSKA